MSFFKNLFGGGAAKTSDPAAAKAVSETEYKGYAIAAKPYLEGGQYQVAGTITKAIDGALKEHRFVRADRFAGVEDAAQVTVNKAKQMIDQQGDKIFG